MGKCGFAKLDGRQSRRQVGLSKITTCISAYTAALCHAGNCGSCCRNSCCRSATGTAVVELGCLKLVTYIGFKAC